jgi:electron transport complex protein RnfB
VLALNPSNGVAGPPLVAQIDEARCIGCVKCLSPCPVDAIIGAKQLTHTVVAQLCTGCELCVAPCPVDCIVMIPRSALRYGSEAPDAAHNRARFTAHSARLARRAAEQAALIAATKHAAGAA